MNFLRGQVLVFDKPLGMTSFQLVAKVRWLITRAMGGRKLKVGHAGTLDPLASGLMLLCTGRATKQIEQLQAGVKAYEATLQLGATTPSYDLEHPVDHTFPTEHITEPLLRQVLHTFEGDIMQVPPVFSACKVEGVRAYDMARKGRGHEVTLQAKPLHIDEISLTAFRPHTMQADIRVEALHSGAHLIALRRTQVGNFTVQQAYTLPAFEEWLSQQSIETDLD